MNCNAILQPVTDPALVAAGEPEFPPREACPMGDFGLFNKLLNNVRFPKTRITLPANTSNATPGGASPALALTEALQAELFKGRPQQERVLAHPQLQLGQPSVADRPHP